MHELSGGMHQRVLFARALAVDPEIGLRDESSSQLEPVTSLMLCGGFRRIVRQLGRPRLFVAHRIDDAL